MRLHVCDCAPLPACNCICTWLRRPAGLQRLHNDNSAGCGHVRFACWQLRIGMALQPAANCASHATAQSLRLLLGHSAQRPRHEQTANTTQVRHAVAGDLACSILPCTVSGYHSLATTTRASAKGRYLCMCRHVKRMLTDALWRVEGTSRPDEHV